MVQDSHSEQMKKYRQHKMSRKRKKKILRLLAGVMVILALVAVVLFVVFKTSEKSKKENEAIVQVDLEKEQPEPTVTVTESEVEGSVEVEEVSKSPTEKRAREILDGMTMEEKVYQLFVVTQEQLTGVGQVTQSGPTSQNAIQKYPVGGIIYFAPNLLSRDQCKSMIDKIQQASKLGLFIAVDEEGGAVARLGKNAAMGTTAFGAMGSIGETGDVQKAYEVGYTIGSDIRELGFNLDFAPVADVWSNPENKVIGSRAFGSEPEKTAEMVSSCVSGFLESGTLCTLKHFPGHGDTASDSHYGKVFSSKTLEELRKCELLPFEAGIEAGAQFVMVGHINLPNVTKEDVPATFSYEVITALLREEMGFQGIVITDSMAMQAITKNYSSAEAAVYAIAAGADMILMPQNLQDAAAGLMQAIEGGVITEERINESVLRILKIKISQGIIKE